MDVAQVTIALSEGDAWYVLTDASTLSTIMAALPGAIAEPHHVHIREEFP